MHDQDCVDVDNGATGDKGDGCNVYYGHPNWCGDSDDNDFFSSTMCCACGGGIKGIMWDILYDISYLLGNGKFFNDCFDVKIYEILFILV